LANSQLNTNDASVAQLQTARFEHGPALLIAGLREQYPKRFPSSATRFSRTVNMYRRLTKPWPHIFQRWLLASGHEIGHGDPDAPDMIERYGENFDLQTGSRSNFGSFMSDPRLSCNGYYFQ
jgi:hypothetical protein